MNSNKSVRPGRLVAGALLQAIQLRYDDMPAVSMLEELRKLDSDILVIIGGSVITPEDGARMREGGVAAVFVTAMDGEKVIETVRALNAS